MITQNEWSAFADWVRDFKRNPKETKASYAAYKLESSVDTVVGMFSELSDGGYCYIRNDGEETVAVWNKPVSEVGKEIDVLGAPLRAESDKNDRTENEKSSSKNLDRHQSLIRFKEAIAESCGVSPSAVTIEVRI